MTEVVLAFDCAVQGLGVAVVQGGVTLASRREEGREQAARLVPAIAEVLTDARVEKRALSMIAVTTGPGSFTGVRVGLATARGLAVALSIPLAGIATTACLLAQAAPGGRLAVAAIDTHLGDWFCAVRAEDEAPSEVAEAPFVTSTEGLAERLAGRPCTIVGLEAERLASLLPEARAQMALPDPAVIARLALGGGIETWTARNRAEGLPRPLYLRGVNITTPDGTRRTVE